MFRCKLVARRAVMVVGAMGNAASTPQASCGHISIVRSILSPHRVPSPCRLTWTGVCLSSVFANFATDTQIFFTYRLGG